MKTNRNRIITVIIALALIFGLTACETGANKANNADRKTAAVQLGKYQKNQPVPVFDYSQLRQNAIEIETAQAKGTQTTTFFFNQGVQDPTDSCPSTGFPIPSTAQITNPEAKVERHDITIPQIEANGIYTGDSTGTYIMCIDAHGEIYANYWEGFVRTVSGPAKWNQDTHQVELIGSSSFKFSKNKATHK
jgi:hypothetical protein